jgi:hypothetical protein
MTKFSKLEPFDALPRDLLRDDGALSTREFAPQNWQRKAPRVVRGW